jgi:hypothetical protein
MVFLRQRPQRQRHGRREVCLVIDPDDAATRRSAAESSEFDASFEP